MQTRTCLRQRCAGPAVRGPRRTAFEAFEVPVDSLPSLRYVARLPSVVSTRGGWPRTTLERMGAVGGDGQVERGALCIAV